MSTNLLNWKLYQAHVTLTVVKRDTEIGISCLVAKMERGWSERKKGKLKLLSES